jgi:hypothetical protein
VIDAVVVNVPEGELDAEGDLDPLGETLADADTHRVAVGVSEVVVVSVREAHDVLDGESVDETVDVCDTELLAHTVGDRESVGLAVMEPVPDEETDTDEDVEGLGVPDRDARTELDGSGDRDVQADTVLDALNDGEPEGVPQLVGVAERDMVTETDADEQ